MLDVFAKSKKDLLPYESAHSKTIKSAIGTVCLESALTKSCVHMVETSFKIQVERLQSAGFPSAVVCAFAETLLQKLKEKQKKKTPEINRSKDGHK